MDALKARIDALLAQKNFVIVGIDGPCASGKTTLAAKLEEMYGCSVIHLDSFFLRPEQRTAERLAEIGGNVDYERFKDEVLTPLKAGISFTYRPIDCSSLTLAEPITLTPKKLNVIEGSYSHHPYFGDPYDLKLFLTVNPELQQQRILQRPSFLHQRFFNQWIPMEAEYFAHFQIRQLSDMVL